MKIMDLEHKIKFLPGKDNGMADLLSRLIIKESEKKCSWRHRNWSVHEHNIYWTKIATKSISQCKYGWNQLSIT
jgi:hypothetical protein